MTFAALATWQAWLLLGAAAALAAGLFLLKLRPPRVAIPSLLFWRRILDESRELTLWERIRRAVSLVLTVLVALALALAAVRPRRAEGRADAAAGRLLIVLDSSWSMQARTRGGETRWERATAEARRLAVAASGAEVALATTADGLVEGPTGDAALIESALDRLSATGGGGLAWPQLPGTAAVHFITDGAVPRSLDPAVIVHSVFEPAPNAAVTAFELRPSLAATSAGDAYLEVANFSEAAQDLQLTLRRGDATIFDRTFNVGPAEMLRQVVPVPREGDPVMTARVRAAANALAIDDEARIWVARARPLRVMVIGLETGWLGAALSADPDVRAAFLAPEDYVADPEPAREADVLVFDGWAPSEPPARPALLFAPPPETPWLAGTRPDAVPGVPDPPRVEAQPRWQVPGTHRVVRGVDPFTLTIERARVYTSPALVPVASSSRGTPLVSVTESAETRRVVVSFSARDSNLTGAPGFPVLMGNALEWLARPAAEAARSPGLALFAPGIVRVTGPEGAVLPLTPIGDAAAGLLRAPGIYTAEGGGSRSNFAVNLGDPLLSNLSRTMPAAGAAVQTVRSGAPARPLWVYFAAIAFLMAVAEWWTWQRRITV